jgi:hypothetical protein
MYDKRTGKLTGTARRRPALAARRLVAGRARRMSARPTGVDRQPARTKRVGADLGSRNALPRNRTLTRNRPRRRGLRVRKVTLLRNLQSSPTRTVRDEIVKLPAARWILTDTLPPRHSSVLGRFTHPGVGAPTGHGTGRWQYNGFELPGGQTTGTAKHLAPDVVGTTPGGQNGGGTTLPLVVNLYGRVRSRAGVVVDVTRLVAARIGVGAWAPATVGTRSTAVSDSEVNARMRFTSAPWRWGRAHAAPSIGVARTLLD